MKKILFVVVCFTMIGIQSVKAQLAVAALHHEGNVTIYSAAGIQSAMDAAVKGDTIYLSEGTFGGFTVSKPIAIIGAGQTTGISSDITIGSSSSSNVYTIESGLYLSGLNISQDIRCNNAILDGLRIAQCKIGGYVSFDGSSNSSYDNIEILMSQVLNMVSLSDHVKGLTVIASKIGKVSGLASGEGAATFVNCNVKSSTGTNSTSKRTEYVNCIIETLNNGIFTNCLYSINNTSSYSGTVTDSYEKTFTFDENLSNPMTDEELRRAGYLGSDGTVVGINGGQVHFSLVMPILQVTEHSIEVNQTERKLNVSLKLGNK